MKLNPELMADIAEVAVRAERMFLKAQFNATSQKEIEWAQSGLRHARGLGKVVQELPPAEKRPG